MLGYDTGFHEVGDRIWVARYEWHDVNITVIEGGAGLLMIDTHASTRAAVGVIDHIRRAGLGEVTVVVNTHEHFDHTFGNAAVRSAYGPVPIHATQHATDHTLSSAVAFKARFAAQVAAGELADPRTPEILQTDVVAPDRPFVGRTTLDLGGRTVELVHPGRGHTAGDLVTWVPDANLLQAGDLLEETGPPVYTDHSYPLDWPATIDVVLDLIDDRSTVVPGHGVPVDKEWVRGQRAEIAQVADTIQQLGSEGVPIERAVAAASWPWPTDDWRFAGALQSGYAQLGLA
ncbi:MBL fold metallo-hydrolase [Nocardioides houyundeii]|uniref:MBL fold metallo-hydrolase n=1 Tax=Nocardioides houyundeii TaxID=2045452 RepID=UPI000DF2A2CB|nr:MBL fold metallo-hydrolase [Nocardioides houyundeii]